MKKNGKKKKFTLSAYKGFKDILRINEKYHST